MSRERYPKEFKIETAKQVVDRSFSVVDVDAQQSLKTLV